MGQCVIMTNTYPGIDPDECTAKREHILVGYKAGVNGEEEPVAGTMHHLTNESTIQHESGNATKVIKADERYIGNNTDGVRRMSLRYNGTPGYIAANTLVGLPAQTKTVTPSVSQQTIGPDGGKLLENVIVNAIPNNRGVGAHGVSSGVNAQGLYYYIPSGWYPADGSGNSWVYRTLPEIANTIGLTADKIKRGVTVGGVAGTCDWAVGGMATIISDQTVTPDVYPLSSIKSYLGSVKYSITGQYTEFPYIVLAAKVYDVDDKSGTYMYHRILGRGGTGSEGYVVTRKNRVVKIYLARDSNNIIDVYCCSTTSAAVRIVIHCYGGSNADLNG